MKKLNSIYTSLKLVDLMLIKYLPVQIFSAEKGTRIVKYLITFGANVNSCIGGQEKWKLQQKSCRYVSVA